MTTRALVVAVVVLAAGCGGKDTPPEPGEGGTHGAARVAAVAETHFSVALEKLNSGESLRSFAVIWRFGTASCAITYSTEYARYVVVAAWTPSVWVRQLVPIDNKSVPPVETGQGVIPDPPRVPGAGRCDLDDASGRLVLLPGTKPGPAADRDSLRDALARLNQSRGGGPARTRFLIAVRYGPYNCVVSAAEDFPGATLVSVSTPREWTQQLVPADGPVSVLDVAFGTGPLEPLPIGRPCTIDEASGAVALADETPTESADAERGSINEAEADDRAAKQEPAADRGAGVGSPTRLVGSRVTNLLAALELVKRTGFHAPCAGPADRRFYRNDAFLSVIVAYETDACRGARAYFFANSRFVGVDVTGSSSAMKVAQRDARGVTLSYALFRPGDASCCPSGGDVLVRFRWSGERLQRLDAIPAEEDRTPG